MVTLLLYSKVLFGTSWMTVIFKTIRLFTFFRDTLNKEVSGLLFILIQNTYLYTLAFSYAQYVPVNFHIPSVYKLFSPVFNHVLCSL